jgi:hypothetical protein
MFSGHTSHLRMTSANILVFPQDFSVFRHAEYCERIHPFVLKPVDML